MVVQASNKARTGSSETARMRPPPQSPKVVTLHPDQTPQQRRLAMRGTYMGKPYRDGKTVRLAWSRA